jgi:hypothetical protein
MNNAAYYNNIRHTLECIHVQPLVITDPIGYETSEEEFTRTFKNVGIISNFSTDLRFVDDAKDFIENIIENYGLNETITIKKEGQDPNTDEWLELYTSTLDLLSYRVENYYLKTKINSGGIDKIFKARESEKIEVEKTLSIDGTVIPSLEKVYSSTQGRDIFLNSLLEVKINDDTAFMSNSDVGGVRGKTVCVPISIKNRSDTLVQTPIPNTTIDDKTDDRSGDGVLGIMFYVNSDRDKTLNISFDIEFKIDVYTQNLDAANFWFRLATYQNGSDYNYKSAINIWQVVNVQNYNGSTQVFSFSQDIDLKQGESLSLQFSQQMNGENTITGQVGRLNTTSYDIVCNNFKIKEDSSFPSTTTQTLLLHDLGERLSYIITGRSGRFKSSVLGRQELGYQTDGYWAYLGTYCGHWLRGFGLEDSLYKKYATSFKDFSQSLKAVLNVHVGFQSIGFEEQVIAEQLTHFFNPNIVLVLPNPLTNVKRYVAEDLIFSGINCGYEKGGNVEGIMGLDEPNGEANWVSNMSASKNNLSIRSKYIAGVYDEEKQRRFQKNDYPTQDTDRDKDIFIKDLKKVEGYLVERTWQDDFQSEPTGIFSPETAKNLRLSPANNLRRHGNLISTALSHYQNESLSFGSSSANSGMVTQIIGSSSIKENGSVLNSDLDNRLFEPFYIEGDHLVDTSIMNTLKDFSTFDNVQVSNFYCKVQFTLEGDPTLRFGFIMSLKPNGSGKWKFIEASNITSPQQ